LGAVVEEDEEDGDFEVERSVAVPLLFRGLFSLKP